jgi:hypothetical protein
MAAHYSFVEMVINGGSLSISYRVRHSSRTSTIAPRLAIKWIAVLSICALGGEVETRAQAVIERGRAVPIMPAWSAQGPPPNARCRCGLTGPRIRYE